jgi:hypothetical protein
VSAEFFNPSLGDSVEIHFDSAEPSRVTLQVLDRNTVITRTLLEDPSMAKGRVRVTWDGRDAAGSIVPDEAYSVRILPRSATGTEEYFPGLRVSAKPLGPTASARQPGGVVVFVDYIRVKQIPAPASGEVTTSIDLRDSAAGKARVVTVNWGSEYGPTAVNSVRVVAR